MACLLGRRVAVRTSTSWSLRAAAGFHTYSGAISKNLFQLKPGENAAYMATAEKIWPEVAAIPGFMKKGVTSVGAFSTMPKPGTMIAMNCWESVDAAVAAASAIGPIMAKVADHLDFECPPQREVLEADFVDYGVLQPNDAFQPLFVSIAEMPVKPGTAKGSMRDFIHGEYFSKKVQEMGPVIASWQCIAYASDVSILAVSVWKDRAGYIRFNDEAIQKQIADMYKESGLLEIMTGPIVGRTVFPEGFYRMA